MTVRGPSLTRAEVVSTATNPPPRTPTTPSQGSSDDQQVHEQGADPEDVHDGNRQRPVSAPRAHGDTEDTGAWVPQPRRGDGRDSTVKRSQTAVGGTKGADPDWVTNLVRATLTAGSDGAVWVNVDGVDVHEVAARISAVCDVLNRARPPR